MRRLGRNVEAKQEYDAAIAHSDNPAERSFLRERRLALDDAP
ncbi:MAG TPA: hypothetical protein VN750_13475 [Steroidobacteraceae bacterium]|nr:hypothetical protein [Steroidobacteraceae bacterium]